MIQLHLRLLGAPEITYGDRLAEFATRKALALLIYLAVEGGCQARDSLAALLWPESDAARARANLRNALHQARSALPEHTLIARGDAICFQPEVPYSLDIQLVEEAFEAREEDALQTALRARRGEFIEGFSLPDAPAFDTWAAFQRQFWQRRLGQVFAQAYRLQMQEGRSLTAAETALAWVQHDDLDEDAHLALMQAHFAAGDLAAAREAFRRCKRLLASELGADPSPQILALATQLEKPRPPATQARATETSQRAPAQPFAQIPLVGRAAEFGLLVEGYHRSVQGGPQYALILGEAGIGKSRLAGDFLGWAQAQGAEVLAGRGYETGLNVPYQTLVGPLRARVRAENAPDDWLDDIWLSELARLLPELRLRYPDLSASQAEDAARRTRLFEAVTRLLMALSAASEPAPLVLLLDDLQWADSASLDLLSYALERWQEEHTSIFLLAAARGSEDFAGNPPGVGRWLQHLRRHLAGASISLGPLDAGATHELVSAVAAGPDDDLAGFLYAETGGQPLYLVETLNDLVEQNWLRAAGDSGRYELAAPLARIRAQRQGRLPDRVRQVIGARLDRLSQPALNLLSAAAVVGNRTSFPILCAVAALSEEEGLQALDELRGAQLLDQSEREYEVAHDTIRALSYVRAGTARRRVYHRRALRALQEQAAPPAVLAHHAIAAGAAEEALHHSLAAGKQALSLFACREAVSHFEQARQFGRQQSTQSGVLRALYLGLGRAHELCGEYDRALAVYQELEERAQANADKPLHLAALMARTAVYATPTRHYDPANVDILSQEALPLARELGDHRAEARILWSLMLHNIFTGEMDQAAQQGEASLAIARSHGLREQLAYTLHDLVRVYLFRGRTDKALQVSGEAQAIWRELGNTAMLADSLNVIGGYYMVKGDYVRALSVCAEALELSRRIGNVWNQSFAHLQMGTTYLLQGEIEHGIEHSRLAIEYGEQAGFMIPSVLGAVVITLGYGLVGRPEEGEAWAAKAMEVAEQMHPSLRVAPLAAQALLAIAASDLGAAAAPMEQALALFQPEANHPALFILPPIAGVWRLRTGQFEQALQESEHYLDLLERWGFGAMTSSLYLVKARALEALGREGPAATAAARAKEIASRLGEKRPLMQFLDR